MTQKTKESTLEKREEFTLDYFIPYRFNQVANKTNLTMAKYLATLNVTVPQWRVLAILISFGELSIGEIADHAALRQSTLSRVVDQLEKQNLVKRNPLSENKRIVRVIMTKKGMGLFDKIYPAALSLHTFMADALSNEDRENLYKIFDKLIGRLDLVQNSWANVSRFE